LNIAFSPTAAPIPPATPPSDPSVAIAAASALTLQRIWRRDAPSVRSSPNSRIRWATVIEKMLKIRNEATTITTPASTSRMVGRKLRLLLISSVLRPAAWSPLSTSSARGSTRPTRRARALGEVPGSAWIDI